MLSKRKQVDLWFRDMLQHWENQGMPMLGAMLRIMRWAYQHGQEGSLESLMDSWLYGAERMQARTMGKAYARDAKRQPDQTHPDDLSRSRASERRHQEKHNALRSMAAEYAAIRKKKLTIKRKKR